ncbi:hypothetical protein emb_1c0031 [Coriobacteriaceae bacterium EMTCatB1]|nr:hypothetical protein emb_1c0031 [Coriobacteriaceae bacterium EMTCatB1]
MKPATRPAVLRPCGRPYPVPCIGGLPPRLVGVAAVASVPQGPIPSGRSGRVSTVPDSLCFAPGVLFPVTGAYAIALNCSRVCGGAQARRAANRLAPAWRRGTAVRCSRAYASSKSSRFSATSASISRTRTRCPRR